MAARRSLGVIRASCFILKKVYGNTSNLSRVFEIKQAINGLVQEDMEFTKHLGRFRSLWSELEMLRPSTTDADELNKRLEQDKVFGLNGKEDPCDERSTSPSFK